MSGIQSTHSHWCSTGRPCPFLRYSGFEAPRILVARLLWSAKWPEQTQLRFLTKRAAHSQPTSVKINYLDTTTHEWHIETSKMQVRPFFTQREREGERERERMREAIPGCSMLDKPTKRRDPVCLWFQKWILSDPTWRFLVLKPEVAEKYDRKDSKGMQSTANTFGYMWENVL